MVYRSKLLRITELTLPTQSLENLQLNGNLIIRHQALITNTPNKIGSSPAKRLFCRWLRCDIPAINLNQQLIPNVPNMIKQQRMQNKKYFDKGTQKDKELRVGDNVYVKQNPKENWVEGNIEKQVSNRSYIVNSNDKQYRRNTIHIMKPNANQQNTVIKKRMIHRVNHHDSQISQVKEQVLH